MLNVAKGVLVEYALSIPPMVLVFEFNPKEISRTRTIQINNGNTPTTRGGYDFTLPTETPRVAQGVTVNPETFSIEILLDATDRMNDEDAIATSYGIEPEMDTLRSMVEPKPQGGLGGQLLASLDQITGHGFERDEHASVLLFIWGTHVLPIFLTSVTIREVAHLPSLVAYRANATLNMQVIEGNNPFYEVEKVRQTIGAALNTSQNVATAIEGLF